jgi:hypothetical protein
VPMRSIVLTRTDATLSQREAKVAEPSPRCHFAVHGD